MADHLYLPVDPAHQATQDCSWGHFEAPYCTARCQCPTRFAPSDGLDDLFDEPLLQKFLIIGLVRLCRDIRPDRISRWGGGDARQCLGHPVSGRLHEG